MLLWVGAYSVLDHTMPSTGCVSIPTYTAMLLLMLLARLGQLCKQPPEHYKSSMF